MKKKLFRKLREVKVEDKEVYETIENVLKETKKNKKKKGK